MRINVIGTSGSGKSTFSKRIAEKLNIPYIELDALFWKANWTESTIEEFSHKIQKAVIEDDWVLDGNYSRTEDIKWQRVQMVVFLDLPFHLVLYRIISRSLIRSYKGQKLWAGNEESIRRLFTQDSIIWNINGFRTILGTAFENANVGAFFGHTQAAGYDHVPGIWDGASGGYQQGWAAATLNWDEWFGDNLAGRRALRRFAGTNASGQPDGYDAG